VPSLQEQVLIGAPPEKVFERLIQPERGPEWTPNLIRVERTSAVEAGPGLETTMIANVGGRQSRGIGRCVAWEPPRRLVLESRLDVGVNSITDFELLPATGGTQLIARVDYTLPASGLGRLVGGLLGDTLARKDLRKALSNLKEQLESEARGV
jgi:uncharacterized protein YndB with AHSA1/START domain